MSKWEQVCQIGAGMETIQSFQSETIIYAITQQLFKYREYYRSKLLILKQWILFTPPLQIINITLQIGVLSIYFSKQTCVQRKLSRLSKAMKQVEIIAISFKLSLPGNINDEKLFLCCL